MAYEPARLYSGTPGITLATVYTVPALKSAIAKFLHVSNNTATAATFTMEINGVVFCTDLAVGPKDTISPKIMYPLATGQTIKVQASAASTLTVHITGVTY